MEHKMPGQKKSIPHTLSDIIRVLGTQKKLLLHKFGVLDLAVFGSYAKEQQNKNSDIDIYVQLEKKSKTFDNFMDLRFYLEELLPGKKVDLVIKDSIRPELKPHILQEAISV